MNVFSQQIHVRIFLSFRGSEKGPVLVQLLFVGGISDCKRKFLLHLGKAVST